MYGLKRMLNRAFLVVAFSGAFLSNPVVGEVFCKDAVFFRNTLVKQDKKKKKSTKKAHRTSEAFMDAIRYKAIGDQDKAKEFFQKVIEQEENNAAAYYELSRLIKRDADTETAIQYAKKAADIEPSNVWYQENLAKLYMEVKSYPQVVDIYSELVKINPENYEYLYELASAYLMNNQYSKAIGIYDVIEDKLGISEPISVQKYKIYRVLEKEKKAVREIEKLIAADPLESKHYLLLAEMYMSEDQTDEAFVMYSKVAEICPDDPYIHITLADYYRKIKNADKSFAELQVGFANTGLDVDTKIQILLSYYTISEYYQELKDQAFVLLEILIKAHPGDPKTFAVYGDFLLRDEKYEEAREAFRAVLDIDSSRYLIWENILRLDAQLDDNHALITDSKNTIALFPYQPLPYFFNGLASFFTKDYKTAVISFEQGVNYVIGDEELKGRFYTFMGDAYHSLGDDAKAFDAYDKLLIINPSDAYVLNNYSYYLCLKGESLQKAEAMAYQATQLDPENPSNLDTYGWVLYKMGQFEKALKYVQMALDAGKSGSAVILEHYGDILYAMGRTDEALQYWKKADSAGEGSKLLKEKIEKKKLIEE